MPVQKQSVATQKKPKPKRPIMRSRDYNLIRRAEAACGLRGVTEDDSMALESGQKHVFQVDVTGNFVLCGEGDLVSFAAAEFVALYPEGVIKSKDGRGREEKTFGKRIRLMVLRAHFENGEIHIGGATQKHARPKSEDGYHGLYELPNGRVCFRRDIPEDYEGREIPAGLYKDLRMISGTHPLSIFAHSDPLRASNRRARQLLTAALTLIEAGPKQGGEMEVPFALVARAAGVLDLRFMKGDINDVERVTDLLVDVTTAGFWALPGLEDVMVAKANGVVKDVSESHIFVEWDDGSGEMFHAPRAQIVKYIRERVHAKMANLPVVPLVEQGERFDKGTVLWGGSSDVYASVEDFMGRNVPADVNEQQALQLLRVWAILATGTHTAELEVYPLKYVKPRKATQVYFRPFVSRVALPKHPNKLMAAEGVGIHVDLFTSSHRDRYWREYREHEERRVQSA